MNLEGEEVLDQQLMAPTAGRGCTIPSKRKMEYPETMKTLNYSENRGAEQPAAMIVDEGSGQIQCEDWKASGSLGHHHEESLSELDQRCIGHMEAASAETSGSTGVPTRTSPAAPPLPQSCPP
jgi:hypothetical protein